MMTVFLNTINDTASWLVLASSKFIYDYQTLVTGVLAVGAAYYGASPVWRQLRDSNLQTQIMLREGLAERLHETEERTARVSKEIDDGLWKAQELTSDPHGDAPRISEQDAFGLEQMIEGRLNWYLVTLRDTETAYVEDAKRELKKALDSLTDTLSDIHWPAHNDQSGEDYSKTDEEWAEVLQKAETGKSSVAQKVSDAWEANRALKSAHEKWIGELRKRISRLDLRIAHDN